MVLGVKHFSETPTRYLSYEHKSQTRMKICIFTINTHLRGILEELLLLCAVLFTVQSWFCWFKQCEEMSNCPRVAAEWAVKPRGWALWLAGSSLPYINNNKIKTVTKSYLCTNQDRLQVTDGYKSCASNETVFKDSVWLLSSPSLILKSTLTFVSTVHSHTYSTIHTHSSACIQTCATTQRIASKDLNKKNISIKFPP